jgi:hypothetical protein
VSGISGTPYSSHMSRFTSSADVCATSWLHTDGRCIATAVQSCDGQAHKANVCWRYAGLARRKCLVGMYQSRQSSTMSWLRCDLRCIGNARLQQNDDPQTFSSMFLLAQY